MCRVYVNWNVCVSGDYYWSSTWLPFGWSRLGFVGLKWSSFALALPASKNADTICRHGEIANTDVNHLGNVFLPNENAALIRNRYIWRKCIRISGEGKAWWSKGERAAACQCGWRSYRHTESSVPVCVCGASSRPEWGRGRRPSPQLVIDPSPTCSALYSLMSWPSPLLKHVLTYFLNPHNKCQTCWYVCARDQKILCITASSSHVKPHIMYGSNAIYYHHSPW